MDLIRRIRWGNVARAAALVVAVALLVAWPRLRSEPPVLPPEPALAAPEPIGESREFGIEAPAESRDGAQRRRAESRAPRRATSRVRRKVSAGGRVRRQRVHSVAPVVAAPQPMPVPKPAPAPVWRPPAPQTEFGLGE